MIGLSGITLHVTFISIVILVLARRGSNKMERKKLIMRNQREIRKNQKEIMIT